MDTKNPPTDPLPPAYTDEPPSYHSQSPSASTDLNKSYYSTQIQSQLNTLTTNIQAISNQKSVLTSINDSRILSLLTANIQTYISQFAATGLYKGTLILVPKQAIKEENAKPCEFDDSREGEFDVFVRVSEEVERENKDSKGEKGREKENEVPYEDFGRSDFNDEDENEEGDLMYWRDERMARRLAGYLRPKKEVVRNAERELPPRKEEKKEKEKSPSSPSSSKGFWGRKKSVTSPIEQRVRVEDMGSSKLDSDVKVVKTEVDDKVSMDVRAEEVVFRTENDFGIFETKRGWGIVVKLRVVLAKR